MSDGQYVRLKKTPFTSLREDMRVVLTIGVTKAKQAWSSKEELEQRRRSRWTFREFLRRRAHGERPSITYLIRRAHLQPVGKGEE